MLIRARSRCRLLLSSSFGCALGVVGFISVHWVYLFLPWVSFGSFRRDLRVYGLIQARPWGRRVYLGSFRSFRRFLRTFGLILRAIWAVGLIRTRPGLH